MSLVVYGIFGSFCTQKIYLTLAEKGVIAERRSVNIGPKMENYEPWYARLNPKLVVPTLVHNGKAVCDSAAIVRYIDAHFDGPELMPKDATLCARSEEWIERVDSLKIRELSYGSMGRRLRAVRDRFIMPMRIRRLRYHMEREAELREVYAARIRDVESWMATMQNPAEMDVLREELSAVLDGMNDRLKDALFLVGDSYTLADMMATVLCARLRLLAMDDLSSRPHVVAHYERMRQRPAFPKEDVPETLDKKKMLAVVGPFLLPRLGLLLLLVGVAVWLYISLV